MKDELGVYYHPQPGNTKARVYVRYGEDGDVQFRLWQADHPEVWEKHEWINMDIIHNAAAMYAQSGRGAGGDPTVLYDLSVAKALLAEEGA